MKSLEVKKDIHWVGALDPDLRIFDIIMYTPYGTTYNSYVVKGSEKVAIFETVKEQFFSQYLERLKSLDVDVTKIDYIIVDHTEPDHAGSVAKLLDLSPKAKVIGSLAAINFVKKIANKEFEYITVNDNATISLGNKTMKFISAPFLHWPDSIYTYIPEDKVLITCDSFGSHYCTNNIFNDVIENNDHYMEALKYYYDCIFGPFKPYVLKAIDKIEGLDIDIICPGHGPVLRDDPWKTVNLYKKWSTPKTKGEKAKIVVSYVSAYGYTKTMADEIVKGINSKGDYDINMYDVIHHDMSEIVNDIADSDGVLFGSPTINSDLLEPVRDVLTKLNPIVHGNKVAGAFGSYGWSGEAIPNMENRLKELRMDLLLPSLKINFKPSETDLTKAYRFGESFAEKINEKRKPKINNGKKNKTKLWKCVICGEIFEGNEPPETCPACGASSDEFVEVKSDDTGFTSSETTNFVILGNGAAGLQAATAIRNRNKNASITMISKEDVSTYYRPQLSDYIGKDFDNNGFFLNSKEWFKENNIIEKLGVTVEKIDKDNNTLLLNDGSKISYDKLILANGSYNFIPNTKVSGLSEDFVLDSKNYHSISGVYTLKYLQDAKILKDALGSAKKAIIVGGGLLGLEAAAEIEAQGIETTVVEFSNRLLPRQLDSEGSRLFKSIADNSSINILLGTCVEEIITENNKVKAVKLTTGNILEADLILFSVGIRSNIDLALSSGIECNRGIIVNEKMETNIPNIYASGDVAELSNIVYGNWPAALDMGKVAGANACGDNVEFKGFVSSVIFNGLNAEIFSAGTIDFDDASYDTLIMNNSKTYKKLFFKDKIIVGGILIGDTSKAAKIIMAMEKLSTMEEVISSCLL